MSNLKGGILAQNTGHN